MKRVKHTLLYLLAAGAMLLTGCSDDFFGDKTEQHDSNRIQLSGDIDQLAVTRVNDNGFCNGDVMGVYIVDYEGNKPGTLKVNGNQTRARLPRMAKWVATKRAIFSGARCRM